MKRISVITAFCLITTSIYADVEDDIFKSGVMNTIKVMKYQKKLSIQPKEYSGKMCYEIHPKDGNTKLDEFSIIKLEALSLIAETDPLYYKDKKNHKKLCFFTAKTKEEYAAKKKLIEDKYDDIKQFHPQQVILNTKSGVIPVLPSLGKWNLDMSGAIEALNHEIASLKNRINEKQKALAKSKEELSRVIKTFKGLAAQIEKTAETTKSDFETKKVAKKFTDKEKKEAAETLKKELDKKAKQKKMLI